MLERLTSPSARRRWRWLGWILLLGASLVIVLMPDQLSPATYSAGTILFIYLFFLFVGLAGLVAAVLFLIPAYPQFFRRAWVRLNGRPDGSFSSTQCPKCRPAANM